MHIATLQWGVWPFPAKPLESIDHHRNVKSQTRWPYLVADYWCLRTCFFQHEPPSTNVFICTYMEKYMYMYVYIYIRLCVCFTDFQPSNKNFHSFQGPDPGDPSDPEAAKDLSRCSLEMFSFTASICCFRCTLEMTCDANSRRVQGCLNSPQVPGIY